MLGTDNCEIFILAGGLSSRMRRDKSRVQLGRRTMLEHVRAVAKQTGLRVRVIRRDAVARCGPLGGIYTGLKRSRADYVMFLACDMPFVTTGLLKKMIAAVPAGFAQTAKGAGFPCLLHRESSFPLVEKQIQSHEHSLQALARKLRAKTIRATARELANINTPEELRRAATPLVGRARRSARAAEGKS